MPARKELKVKFTGDAASITKAGARAAAAFKRVGASAKTAAVAFGRVAAVGAGLGFAIKRGFLDPFAQQQEAVESLSAALTATGKGGAASLRLLTEEASRLQRITTAGDEAILKASTSLATLAPSLDPESLKKSQTALVAIADTFFKGDLDSAAIALGKTLGSTTNALARYGITVEDSAAPASEKLAQILGSEVLGAAFDVAQAKAKTLSGRSKQLTNAFGDLRETIGSLIAESLGFTDRTRGLTEAIQAFTEKLEQNRPVILAYFAAFGTNIQTAAITLAGLVRIAFNVGQLIGRAFDIAANLMLAAFFRASEAVRIDWADLANVAQKIFDPLNLIPDFEFESGIERSVGFLSAARIQAFEFGQDLRDIAAASGDIADAWKRSAVAMQELLQARRSAGDGEALTPPTPPLPTVDSPLPIINGLNLLQGISFEKLETKFEAFAKASQKALKPLEQSAINLSVAFSDSLGESLAAGAFNFKRFTDFAIKELSRLAAKFLVFNGLKTLFPGSAFVGSIGKAFGGFLAHGGPADPSRAFIVGERGPELFVPGVAGQVISNQALLAGAGGGDTHVTIQLVTSSGEEVARVTRVIQKDMEDRDEPIDFGIGVTRL